MCYSNKKVQRKKKDWVVKLNKIANFEHLGSVSGFAKLIHFCFVLKFFGEPNFNGVKALGQGHHTNGLIIYGHKSLVFL